MSLGKQLLNKLVRIVDLTHGGYGIGAVMGADHQGLRLKIGNAAYSQAALHLVPGRNLQLRVRR